MAKGGWRKSWWWRKLARMVKRVTQWRCEQCGIRQSSRAPLHAHHITPIAAGGSIWDPDNIFVLCEPCHVRAHGKAPRARAAPRRPAPRRRSRYAVPILTPQERAAQFEESKERIRQQRRALQEGRPMPFVIDPTANMTPAAAAHYRRWAEQDRQRWGIPPRDTAKRPRTLGDNIGWGVALTVVGAPLAILALTEAKALGLVNYELVTPRFPQSTTRRFAGRRLRRPPPRA